MAETIGGVQARQGYAGDVQPSHAWRALQEHASALLVDVRTPAEWTFAGYPDLSSLSKNPLLLSWRLFPQMQLNEAFMEQLQKIAQDKVAPLYFLCRTGGRSREAAMAATAAGYQEAYNIEDGFDGPLDEHSRRGTVAGWRAASLPWRQE